MKKMKTRLMGVGIFLFTLLQLSSPIFAENDINKEVDGLIRDLLSTTEGDVLKSTEKQVYITAGQQKGIVAGNKFEVIRQGELLIEGDPSYGYEETVIAEVEVEKVRQKVSICNIATRSDQPQKGDKAYILRKKVNVAVIGQFMYNDGFNVLTKSLQEKITTAMTSRGIQVVERDQLERLLREQKLGYSGLINSNTAQKVGELLGAEGLIIGTLSDMGNTVTINARLVDIETGKALSASEAELHKTPTIIKLLETPVNQEMLGANNVGFKSGKSPSTTPKRKPKVVGNEMVFQNNFLQIEAKSVRLSPDKKSVSVSLAVTNISNQDILIGLAIGGGGSNGASLDNHQGKVVSGKVNGISTVWSGHSNRGLISNYSKISSMSTTVLTSSFYFGQPVESEKVSLSLAMAKHSGEEKEYFNFSAGLADLHIEK